eukprot:TRINITY_DN12014_c0_g1_i1.p1 TRINITY_DN12014_c0_g1~~TRINITY_DN12014_c0_g1_i1.p1  ORF type:complete len:110 (-),score=13.04 TRINITY_DN12014_c0_g1_i1:18-347(-)
MTCVNECREYAYHEHIHNYCSMCIERDHAEHELAGKRLFETSDDYYQNVHRQLEKLNIKALPYSLQYPCYSLGCLFSEEYSGDAAMLPDVSSLGGIFALPLSTEDRVAQ